MKIHHLSCGTMCPPFAKAFIHPLGHMVCHCLLVEIGEGLVLIDTGLGLDDMRHTRARMGAGFTFGVRPVRDPALCAVHQVERLGFDRRDVRHVVPTHLDLDHAGGIPDFPEARVHVLEPEHAAAMARSTFHEKERYRPVHWSHGPSWEIHRVGDGEPWFGFECVRELEGLPPEILMVPTYGHTRGHAAVAVDTGEGWLVHCGDAYFYEGEMDPDHPTCTPGLRFFQKTIAIDDASRIRNQQRLRALVRDHGDEVRVFSAHDPAEYRRFAAESP